MPDIFTAPKVGVKTITTKKTGINISQSGPENKILTRPVIAGRAGIFAALVHNPQGLTFANQEKDERILIFTRRHFATNMVWIIITFAALFIPLLFSFLLQTMSIKLPAISLYFMIIVYLFYYLVVFGYAFYNYIDWFYNIGIITQKRMIDIDFMHLSVIDVAITQLSEIEDVVFKQQGFFASFFNYGDVVAHTVATFKGKEDFVFESILHPEEVVDLISRLLGD